MEGRCVPKAALPEPHGPNKLSALLAFYPDGEGLTFPFPEEGHPGAMRRQERFSRQSLFHRFKFPSRPREFPARLLGNFFASG